MEWKRKMGGGEEDSPWVGFPFSRAYVWEKGEEKSTTTLEIGLCGEEGWSGN